MTWLQRILHKPFFIKLFNWEYWSMHTVYAPIYPIFACYCIRSGWKYFFSAADPYIENGGFLMESKKKIYDQLPAGTYPVTIFAKGGTSAGEIMDLKKKAGLAYPLMIKPDIGMRGLAAKKVNSDEELITATSKFTIDFLIQEFISLEQEVGIFYYRFPGMEKGKISGVVAKEFLTVTGNGSHTLQQLLQADKRFVLQMEALKKEYKSEMNEVLKDGEKRLLVPYGNHARGAKFLDHSHKVDEQLENFIDGLMKQVPEFYFGRVDMRYRHWEELKQGKNYSIVELNGAGSEPTHIYDPRHSLFFAWKEILRHIHILWRISMKNRKRGFRFMTYREGLKMFRDNKAYVKKLQAVHQSLLHS